MRGLIHCGLKLLLGIACESKGNWTWQNVARRWRIIVSIVLSELMPIRYVCGGGDRLKCLREFLEIFSSREWKHFLGKLLHLNFMDMLSHFVFKTTLAVDRILQCLFCTGSWYICHQFIVIQINMRDFVINSIINPYVIYQKCTLN